MIEPESVELPIERSADPAIDDSLSRARLPPDATSGAALLAQHEPEPRRSFRDASLDEVWNAMPGFAEDGRSKGDAVEPEDLSELPALDELVVSQDDDDVDEDEIGDDDLDL